MSILRAARHHDLPVIAGARMFQGLPTRRELLAGLIGGGTAIAMFSRFALAQTPSRDPAARALDWEWLVGNWDVRNRRLRRRLAGDDQWDEFGGKSAAWLTM